MSPTVRTARLGNEIVLFGEGWSEREVIIVGALAQARDALDTHAGLLNSSSLRRPVIDHDLQSAGIGEVQLGHPAKAHDGNQQPPHHAAQKGQTIADRQRQQLAEPLVELALIGVLNVLSCFGTRQHHDAQQRRDGLRPQDVVLVITDPPPDLSLTKTGAGTSDIEFEYPWGWGELEGVANRGINPFRTAKSSYFRSQDILPAIGYQPSRELVSANEVADLLLDVRTLLTATESSLADEAVGVAAN